MKTKLCSFISLLLLIIGCSDYEEFKGIKITQYATKVIGYSTQFSNTTWSATRALGKPNVYPSYGDLPNAWAPSSQDGKREFLVLGFDTLQTVKTIQIYETWNPGAIDSIFLRDANSQKWNLVYSKPAEKDLPPESRIFSTYLIETDFLTDAIRIALDSPTIPGWNEIDAVAIIGQRKNE